MRILPILIGFGIGVLGGCASSSTSTKSTAYQHSLYSFPSSTFSSLSLSHSTESQPTLSPPDSLSPSHTSTASTWLLILGTATTTVGTLGLLSQPQCSRFTSDRRCMAFSQPSSYWNLIALGGITLTLIGWIHWKTEKDTL